MAKCDVCGICFEKRFPATLDEIDRACSDIKLFLENQGLAHEFFNTALLTREALVNAVVHASGKDASKEVCLRLTLKEDQVLIDVQDQGPGFNWRSLLSSIASPQEDHGRGMMIFNSYASDFQYNEQGNRITLHKRIER